MVAVGHVRQNHKPVHGFGHFGGDNHREGAVLLRHSKVTSVGILLDIRHRMERATRVLVVAFTFALMARERRRSVRELWRVDTKSYA